MTPRASILPRACLLAGAVLLASNSPAFAQEPSDLAEAVADALVNLFASDPTTTASYESATGDAYFVAITNFRIEGSEPDWSILLPEVTVESPRLREEGGFAANRLNFDGAIIEVEGEEVGGWATGYYRPALVPSPDELNDITAEPWPGFPEDSAIRFEDISAMGATVDHVELSGGWTEGEYTVAGFNLPLAALGNDPSIAALSALGLGAIAADLNAAIRIDFDGQRISLDPVTLSVASIADFDLSLAISGPGLFAAAFPSEAPTVAGGKNPKTGGLPSFTPTPVPDPLLDFFRLTLTDRGILSIGALAPAIEGGLTNLAQSLAGEARTEGLAAVQGLFSGKRPIITISATPPEPVTFSEIGEAGAWGPAGLAELLALRITSGN
ncbi:MAG: hypothetical protein IT535_14790 [Bauldia sp.]|nr:hypothetical protein [Bauldia sp.]